VYWGNHPRGRLPRRPATTPCSLGAPSAVGLKALRLRVYFLKPRPVGMGLNGWCCPKLRLRAWIGTICYHCHLSLNTQSSTPSLSLAVHPNINPYANAKLALKDRAIGKPCSATYRTAFKSLSVIKTHIASFEAAKPVQFAGIERRSFPCRQCIGWC
jgi:hypothetical protein